MIYRLVPIAFILIIVLSTAKAFGQDNKSSNVYSGSIFKKDYNWQIYYSDMHAYYKLDLNNGCDQKIYSKEDVSLTYPAISPDGRYLAFVNIDIDENKLFIIDLSSNKIVKSIVFKGIGQMSWSTKGYRLLFVASERNKDGRLFVLDIEANKLEKLETGIKVKISRHSTPPVFMEKDKSVVFSGDDGFIYKYDLEDKALTKILRGTNPIVLDSERIIYERDDGTYYGGIYFLRNLRTQEEKLVLKNVSLGVPIVSPEKEFLIYPKVSRENVLPFVPIKREVVNYYICDIQGKNIKKIHMGYAEFNWIGKQKDKRNIKKLNNIKF